MPDEVLIRWPAIIAELQGRGVSLYRIAAVMEVDWHTVRNWSQGAEPGYHNGRSLLALHALHTGVQSLTT